jgi:hypothetical protein
MARKILLCRLVRVGPRIMRGKIKVLKLYEVGSEDKNSEVKIF